MRSRLNKIRHLKIYLYGFLKMSYHFLFKKSFRFWTVVYEFLSLFYMRPCFCLLIYVFCKSIILFWLHKCYSKKVQKTFNALHSVICFIKFSQRDWKDTIRLTIVLFQILIQISRKGDLHIKRVHSKNLSFSKF